MKHLFKFSLLLLALLLPTTALAHDFEVDGIYYNINGNEASVTYRGTNSWNHNTYSGDVTIPTTVTYGDTTYSVTYIGSNAFNGCTGLTSIIIPNSVTSIGYWAFRGCSGLTSIDIPNSVTSIGYYAFENCSGLTSIDIPNSVTSIGNYAFAGTPWYNNQPDGLVYAGLVAYNYKGTMPSGTCITLRDGTLGIAGGAFESCSGLTSVTIPNSVTSIGSDAFYFCTSLTSIDIPNSVTYIGGGAFFRCSGLANIKVDPGNPKYDSRNNCNAIIETASNTLILGCKNTVIPNSVTSIGENAFSFCSFLTSVTIPNSVTSIGGFAFGGCSGLTNVNIGNSVTYIGGSAFENCSGLTSITIPSSVKYIGMYAFNACTALTTLNYNAIDCTNFEAPFYGLNITTINISDSVQRIPDYFAYYSPLEKIIIPNSVTEIGVQAFFGCSGLTNIAIPNSVITIDDEAFSGCDSLFSVTIGSGVTAIGAKAFNYCNALETVKCLGTVPPVMASADCFSTAAYNRATLLVPRQFVEAYNTADYWYKFAHIDGWGSAGRGDIDGDGAVNIRDVTTLIDAILNGNNEGIYFESADVNINGRLDIGDVTTIVDMLLNDIE